MAGIFDPALKRRAPVDNLFAGRNSLMVPDDKWDDDVALAISAARNALSDPYNSAWIDQERQGGGADRRIRNAVKEESGLLVYPGEVVGAGAVSPEKMTFMTEFSDRGAELKPGWNDGDGLLSDVLKHDVLFQHYPGFANIPVRIVDTPAGQDNMVRHGSFNRSDGVIELNKNADAHDPLGTVLHEIQHAIQHHEGWSGGGNPSMAGSVSKYKNIDGEILARDAVQRSTQERNSEWDLEDAENLVRELEGRSFFEGLISSGVDIDEARESLLQAQKNYDTVGHYPNAYTRYDESNSFPWKPAR